MRSPLPLVETRYNGPMRVTRTLLGVASALLVAFHGWLLAGQFMDGQLAEPWLVLRWIVAAILLASLAVLRRQGHGVLSRKSVAVWVLAALLHGPAVVGHYGDLVHNAAIPEAVATFVLQIAATAALGLILLIVVGLVRRRERGARAGGRPFAFGFHLAGALAFTGPPPFSPRPPPGR